MTGKIRYKKLRLWLFYPFFIAYPFLARMTNASYWCGAVIIMLGILVRFWASGYLSKMRMLADSGPYAHTRNPLYVGNFLVGLGVSVMGNNMILLAFYLVIFALAYRGTICQEQTGLEEKFGQPYRDYMSKVPAFFPSVRPKIPPHYEAFSLRQSFQNGEFIRSVGFVILMLFFYIWKSVMLGQGRLGFSGRAAVVLFIVFLGVLWFNISSRRRAEKEWTRR